MISVLMADDASLETSVGRGNSLQQFVPASATTDVDDGNNINGTAAMSTLPSAGRPNIHFLQLNLQHRKKKCICCSAKTNSST